MELRDLEPFLERENERLLATLPGLTEENIALAQSVKLAEETGELSAAVLAAQDLQRERSAGPVPDTAMEVADVLITALLLGETLDIDLEAALSEKVASIEARYD